ncbi:hypothetical protein [Flavobacterium sp.]|uniref:hypothetical protein n=1 Tax=Flavobacterium sp. TaxID=239 RepID=UPI0039E4C435
MEIINYNIFINKIKESKDNNYELFELKRISWLLNFSDESVKIEDEKVFFNIFSDLLYYIDVNAQNDTIFKQVIDDIIKISLKRKLVKNDIVFILNKTKILEVICKFKENKISKNILVNQLKKYFNDNNYEEIQNFLFEQNIEL